MIYGVLNFVLAALLLWLSYYTDKRIGNKSLNNPIATMNTFLAISCVFMGIAIITSLSMAPERMTTFLAKCMYFFMGLYALHFCIYCICFPSFERNAASRVGFWIGTVFCFWIVFVEIDTVNITEFLGLRIDAHSIFTGTLTNYFPYSWYNFYETFMTFCLPFLSVIIMLLRSENRTSRLDHQKTVITAGALILAWICMKLILTASNRVPLFSTIVLAGFVFAQAVIVMAAIQNFLYDRYAVLGMLSKGLICYIFPACIVGVFFALIWKIHESATALFGFLIVVITGLALTGSYELQKWFQKKTGSRSSRYSETFEEELASMDFSDDPSVIVEQMHKIFSDNLNTQSFRVLIDVGNDEISSVYDAEGEKPLMFNVKDILFDTLLNMNEPIVLKSSVENGYRFINIKKPLLDFFKKTHSDALIILNEGRHILGAILLGEKSGGNIFSDYDYEVFSKLYSYFFVFGYYMKNIGNQEIVGTVNREIHMSEQIIESIQGNMDPIKNKKYDIGHLMIHAHNIGGEFIDLVKLSPDKHIFVMGDLSGKGISASMSMVILKSIIRTYLAETTDFKMVVEKVNKFIRFNLPKGTFFEGLFALIDFNEDTMYYINCGVPAMFLYTRSFNNVVEIQGEGHVLGFVKDIEPYLKVKKVKFNVGDVLVTCTDGLLDSHSLRNEQFGKDRIQKIIMENTSLPAQNIAEVAYSNLVEFVATELEDDVSIFVMKINK